MGFFCPTKEPVQLCRVIPIKQVLERWKIDENHLVNVVELTRMSVFFVEDTRERPDDGTVVYFCNGPFHGTLVFSGQHICLGNIHGNSDQNIGGDTDSAVFNLDEVECVEKKHPHLLWSKSNQPIEYQAGDAVPVAALVREANSALPAMTELESTHAVPIKKTTATLQQPPAEPANGCAAADTGEVKDLESAEAFMRRTGLRYKQLLDIKTPINIYKNACGTRLERSTIEACASLFAACIDITRQRRSHWKSTRAKSSEQDSMFEAILTLAFERSEIDEALKESCPAFWTAHEARASSNVTAAPPQKKTPTSTGSNKDKKRIDATKKACEQVRQEIKQGQHSFCVDSSNKTNWPNFEGAVRDILGETSPHKKTMKEEWKKVSKRLKHGGRPPTQ